MGILRAISGAVSGTFADQWKEIITAGIFDEYTVVSPGILKTNNRGRGTNSMGSEDVISNGSKIFVPENAAAFIFSQSAIENVISTPGGYEYQDGQESVFNGDKISKAIFKQVKDRVGYGGISADEKRIAFVNLREIRDIKFGTRGPQVYNDSYYGADLEIQAYGSFTIKVVEPEKFIRNFVPANVSSYSFSDTKVRSQILSEFVQSFTVALNTLSQTYRISQLPSRANEISEGISNDPHNAGTWKDRFGFEIIKVAIENIEFSPESRELVKQFSSNKMNLRAFEDVSQKSSNIAAQQKIAQGIQDNGLGEGGNMIYGMNMAQTLNSQAAAKPAMSFEQQIETLKKLKELLDLGILSQQEFDTKKKEIMGL
jgi:membrane protease subunit (stomatin/prohibitin family)